MATSGDGSSFASGADPTPGAVTMMSISNRMLPPVGADFVRNLLYTTGFMRVLGEYEGAATSGREGAGKIHNHPDERAADTIGYFDEWMAWGARTDLTKQSVERVRRIHAAYGKRFSMSNETFIHAIASFTLQLEIFLDIVGAPPFGAAERAAQLDHWRLIGEMLGIENMPETWEGMRKALYEYESDPAWFGYTPAGKHSSDALIDQFTHRWFPRRLRWAGRLTVLSLMEPHVLTALGQDSPPAAVAWIVRRSARAALALFQRLRAPKPFDRLSIAPRAA